eukprot:1799919-Rhodomonas_salina.1
MPASTAAPTCLWSFFVNSKSTEHRVFMTIRRGGGGGCRTWELPLDLCGGRLDLCARIRRGMRREDET